MSRNDRPSGDAGGTPAGTPVGSLVRDAIALAAARYGEIDPGGLGVPGSGPLHDARVSLRRIRSYLRTFRSVFESGFASGVRAELGWFATLLGQVRNYDVILERLAANGELVDAPGADRLVNVVNAERAGAVTDLLEGRNSPRYQLLRDHLATLSGEPPLSARAALDAETMLPGLVARPWRDLRGQARLAMRTKSEVDLHALRIRSKELRYASEVAAIVLGKPAARVERAATRIQSRLGSHRDALATAEFLHRLSSGDPVAAFLAGQVVATEQRTAHELLIGLPSDLRRLRAAWRRFESSTR